MMSEDNWVKIEKLKDKITELEKNYEEYIDDSIKRFEKLEKDKHMWVNFIAWATNDSGEIININRMKKELSELKHDFFLQVALVQKLQKNFERVGNAHNERLMDNKDEIKELKGQIKNIEDWINTFNMVLENREVLRELTKEAFLDPQIRKELLDKLGGDKSVPLSEKANSIELTLSDKDKEVYTGRASTAESQPPIYYDCQAE